MALLAAPAATAFPVEPGDVLSVSVTESAEMTRTVKVGADGRIELPVLGGVTVAGMEIDAIRAKLRGLLIDGNLIRDPRVFVEVANYRPFYVGGAVAHPGSYPYEPGMNVRQGIVLAGGTAPRAGAAPPTTQEAIQLVADARAVAFEMLQLETRIALLQAELAEAPKLDLSEVNRQLVDPEAARQVIALNEALLDDSRTGVAAEKDHAAALLKLVNMELDLLGQQTTLQTSEQGLEANDLKEARDLLAKGIVPASRVKELEREGRLLSTQMLDTRSNAARARQTMETVLYTLTKAGIDRRIALGRDLRDALQARETLHARLEGITGQLWTAGLAADPGRSRRPPPPEVTIYRSGSLPPAPVDAGMETAILPGDVLEIRVADPSRP